MMSLRFDGSSAVHNGLTGQVYFHGRNNAGEMVLCSIDDGALSACFGGAAATPDEIIAAFNQNVEIIQRITSLKYGSTCQSDDDRVIVNRADLSLSYVG
jgi:hypothetical protein